MPYTAERSDHSDLAVNRSTPVLAYALHSIRRGLCFPFYYARKNGHYGRSGGA